MRSSPGQWLFNASYEFCSVYKRTKYMVRSHTFVTDSSDVGRCVLSVVKLPRWWLPWRRSMYGFPITSSYNTLLLFMVNCGSLVSATKASKRITIGNLMSRDGESGPEGYKRSHHVHGDHSGYSVLALPSETVTVTEPVSVFPGSHLEPCRWA